jgi:uncharacterized membrane protein YdfJ with MMPL/SSD domain
MSTDGVGRTFGRVMGRYAPINVINPVRGRVASRGDNLAARAGRWSATHRKVAILGWLAFVAAALLAGRAVRSAIADVVDRLRGVDHVVDIRAPAPPGASLFERARSGGAVSPDGHSVLVDFKVAGDSELAEERVDGALAAVAAAQRAHPDLRIEEFGAASSDKAITKSFEDDFHRAELTSLPITLLILVIAFGALVAAGVPLLLAITAVAAAIGLVGPLSQISPVDQAITSVILLVGLAVGVDYSMFYLRREREERAAGRSERGSIEAAAATSGRAVMISGLTVMVAMAGMFLAGAKTFEGFASGTILVVAIAVAGSLTVLPAALSWLGDRVEKGRIPFISRLRRPARESRVWSAVLNPALRHPVVAVLCAGAFLVALAIPTLRIRTALPGIESLPRSLPVMRTYDRIQAAFPGQNIPAQVVVRAHDVTSPTVVTAERRMREQAFATGLFEPPATVDISRDRAVAVVSLPVVGDGTDAKSTAALNVLRHRIIPATMESIGVSAPVTGITARTEDFNAQMAARIWWVFAFVLAAAFGVLLVTFRSIVISLKAILLNLLSVAAAYGVLVLVFQDGNLQSLIGFGSTGAITAWLPLFLFVILFGLSMDYHVFILTRVRESYDRGMSTEDAVAHGIKTTAGVVTSAALVMVAVFLIFATLSAIQFKQMGIGLAAAVLIDATIIRGVMLPATMKLLGDWNWYLPRWLGWLPQVSHGGEPLELPPHGHRRLAHAEPRHAALARREPESHRHKVGV